MTTPQTVALSLAFVLTGCSSLGVAPTNLAGLDSAVAAIKKNLPSLLNDAVSKYDGEADPSKQAAIRNDVISKLLFVADHEYRVYIDGYANARGSANLAFDVVAISTSGAAAITTPAAVARILSAISTGFQGLKKSFDEDLFYSTAMTAIITQTGADRAERRTSINRGLALPTSGYSLYQALSETALYIEAGSLTTAVARLQEKGAATKQKAATEQKEDRDAQFNAIHAVIR